jgi:hypothetical protein
MLWKQIIVKYDVLIQNTIRKKKTSYRKLLVYNGKILKEKKYRVQTRSDTYKTGNVMEVF